MGYRAANADLSRHLINRAESCGGKGGSISSKNAIPLSSAPITPARAGAAEENLFARSLEQQVEIVYGIAYSLYR